MTKEYRYQADCSDYAPINCRYGDVGVDYRSRPVEPSDSGRDFLATEYDVIMAWADLARNALVGEYRENDLKCWEGHYEQFGMVMLNLARMSRSRKGHDGLWKEWYDIFIGKSLYNIIYEGPGSTEDRIFYRCWYCLIGHPDYLHPTISCLEFYTYKATEMTLHIAYEDLKWRLLSLERR